MNSQILGAMEPDSLGQAGPLRIAVRSPRAGRSLPTPPGTVCSGDRAPETQLTLHAISSLDSRHQAVFSQSEKQAGSRRPEKTSLGISPHLSRPHQAKEVTVAVPAPSHSACGVAPVPGRPFSGDL